MQHNDDIRIHLPVPFLKDKTALFLDSQVDHTNSYMEGIRWDLLSQFEDVGYTFAFLPDLVKQLSPALLEYMFPGQEDIVSAEDLYRRMQDMVGLKGKTGFLYKEGRDIFFKALPEGSPKELETTIETFIEYLNGEQESKSARILWKKISRGASVQLNEDRYYGSIPVEQSAVCEEEEPLDPRTQAILDAWEKIEREFGVTPQDIEIILGYRVKLSRLQITTSGRILLSDYDGKEVKMDDLTKAIYFYYLRHTEGARLKELQDHEEEILKYYFGITGRDDVGEIRRSVHKLLDPFGNSLNVCFSRIKKAFKDIVGDRIARFYYVDGRYAESRKIALDRDLVIWEH